MELVITRTEKETIYKFESGESYDLVVIPTKAHRTNEKCAELAWYSVFDGDKMRVTLAEAYRRLKIMRRELYNYRYGIEMD